MFTRTRELRPIAISSSEEDVLNLKISLPSGRCTTISVPCRCLFISLCGCKDSFHVCCALEDSCFMESVLLRTSCDCCFCWCHFNPRPSTAIAPSQSTVLKCLVIVATNLGFLVLKAFGNALGKCCCGDKILPLYFVKPFVQMSCCWICIWFVLLFYHGIFSLNS